MNPSFGAILKSDKCPEKYCSKSSIWKESLPVLIAVILVSVTSGRLLTSGGAKLAVTILIDVVICGGMYALFYFLFSGMKKRMAETYINVCEGGIFGVRAVNGYKNDSFAVSYFEISDATYRGDRAIINTARGKMVFMLSDARGTVELIHHKIGK